MEVLQKEIEKIDKEISDLTKKRWANQEEIEKLKKNTTGRTSKVRIKRCTTRCC